MHVSSVQCAGLAVQLNNPSRLESICSIASHVVAGGGRVGMSGPSLLLMQASPLPLPEGWLVGGVEFEPKKKSMFFKLNSLAVSVAVFGATASPGKSTMIQLTVLPYSVL